MRKVAIALLLSALSAHAQVTVIKAGTLIDGTSSQPKKNQTIVIRGNRIESVGGDVATPTGARIIDLSNMTVLPGMIDAHTHIFLQGEDPALGGYDIQLLKYPLAYRAARATVSARRALEQGFTTIRDMETEGAGYGDVGIKQAINEGHIPGPRIFASTRAAELLGMQGDLGVIAPGAYADIVAVNGDPLQNVDVLKDVRFVMKDGK